MAVFEPTWLVTNIFSLTPASLKQQGIKAVLTDLDNTLMAWDHPEGTAKLTQWLSDLRNGGIQVVVVSNNNANRIHKAMARLQVAYVARALKPLPVGITKARKELGLTRSEVVMVGDQLLTDIWAGNLAGVRTILTQPLVQSDAWNTRINRFFEGFVFKALAKKRQLNYQEDIHGHHQ